MIFLSKNIQNIAIRIIFIVERFVSHPRINVLFIDVESGIVQFFLSDFLIG